MKIVHIVGNRPQFIKLSLLHQAWQHRTGEKSIIIHTGQHFHDNMSSVFFQELNIPRPDYNLQVNNLPHNEMIGRMLIALDPLLKAEKPGLVLVYGDTNSTLAGALAAKKRGIPLVHIESGIRTGNEDMPEESNRYLTDRLAYINLACTYLGLDNLVKEGFTPGVPSPGGSFAVSGKCFNTGDLMLDAAMLFKEKAMAHAAPLQKAISGQLEGRSLDRSFTLATIHRAENGEDPEKLREIIHALNAIHEREPVIFPLHPKTKDLIHQYDIPIKFITTPPLGYLDMLALVQTCRHVVTDSGGLSREAFFFHKPAIIVMQYPFWPEIFLHGNCFPAEASCRGLLERWESLQSSGKPFKTDIFGDGKAAEKICDILQAG